MLPLPGTPPERSITRLGHDSDGDGLALYWTFYSAVAAAQLRRWLPRKASRILDISGGRAQAAAQAAAAGHQVIEIIDPRTPPLGRPKPIHQARTHRIMADTGSLTFLADGCLDAVLAEDRVLSRHLATESTVAEIARVLRPGGRVLLCVDSLMLGMAILAEQNFWAQLSDVPRAEVVLVPWPDGSITRCFWSEQLRELLSDAGFEVEWICPRTALSPSTVEHLLTADPGALDRLVRTELASPVDDESVGIHLLASAIRR